MTDSYYITYCKGTFYRISKLNQLSDYQNQGHKSHLEGGGGGAGKERIGHLDFLHPLPLIPKVESNELRSQARPVNPEARLQLMCYCSFKTS